jgi:hypothetical protein
MLNVGFVDNAPNFMWIFKLNALSLYCFKFAGR